MSKIMRALLAESRGLKRYSVDSDDPGYENWVSSSGFFDVYVDGVICPKVVTADEIEGYVLAFEVPLRVVGDELATRELRGEVRVVKRGS